MQFSLTPEEILIQDMARSIAREKLAPIASELDKGEGRGQFFVNLKMLAQNGFCAINVPSQFGGTEAGCVAFALAIKELAKGCASTAVTLSVTNMVAEVINACGTLAQKEAYISLIADGTYSAAGFCLTESGAGSDPASMLTRAVKDGDDYVITGEKIYITSAPYAGLFVVWAVTDPQAPKGKGITCFLVEASAKGVSIGAPEAKMGQRASDTCNVMFDYVRVPASNILGKLNDGFRIAVGELAGGRIGVAALSLGIAEAAQELALDYVKARKQFGQRIIDFQGIQWMLTDCDTQLEASRLLLLQAAYLKDNHLPFGKAASQAKLYASETAMKVTDTAIQLHGGSGYIEGAIVERLARDARITRIYEGTSEVQRVIISRELMRQ